MIVPLIRCQILIFMIRKSQLTLHTHIEENISFDMFALKNEKYIASKIFLTIIQVRPSGVRASGNPCLSVRLTDLITSREYLA